VPTAYKPTADKDIFRKPEVQELLKPLIFLPSATYPGFDQKAEFLGIKSFRESLRDNMRGYSRYRGTERNFDLTFVDAVHFKNPMKGIIKFWDGSRAGGYGIVERMDTVGEIHAYSFLYRSFSPDIEFNAFGVPNIARGDHVTWTGELAVPNKPGSNKPMPPMITCLDIVHETQY
jgi:hypothetical protein